ncbi:MAG: CocE/NonD family hydrolase [Rhizobiaceae bacterium]
MRTVTEFPRKVRMLEDVGIVMPDGVRLSARIWLPEDAIENPVPVILEHLPYRKRDGTTQRDCYTHPWFAGHGYACIRTDMRGSGDSDGYMEDEYTPQELQDAVDVLAWAAAQPWSTGQAGMMGISWGGFNCLQTAALRPPSLKAVISLCSTVDRYADDIHTKGGCQLTENFGWASNMMAYSSRPPDPAVVGERWREMWLERLERQPYLLSTWLLHQRRDAYWKHGSVCEDYGAIEAAVLSIGGWHDGYRNTISHLVSNIGAPVKGIVGPWIHKYPHYAGPRPAIGFLQEAKRWWDRWLKDIDTGVENDPAMRLWLMDSVKPAMWHDERPGRWIAETQWPSPVIANWQLHLGRDQLETGPAACDVLVQSPADCGLATGEYFPFVFGAELPGEQREDDAKSACFDLGAVDGDRDIVGAPRVNLTVVPRTQTGQLAARLCDVAPDGSSALITMGVFNLTHHASHENPQKLVPGKPVRIAFNLDQIAYRLPAGHTLRLAISTNYWPFIWPACEPSAVVLQSGMIDIPVRRHAAGDEWQFEEAEGAKPWNIRMNREAVSKRILEKDMATGETVITVDNDFGITEDLDHGLWQESRSIERWGIRADDPLSARADIEWTKAMGRDDWQVRMVSVSHMHATKTHFVISARLSVHEGEELLFEREFNDTIERDHV